MTEWLCGRVCRGGGRPGPVAGWRGRRQGDAGCIQTQPGPCPPGPHRRLRSGPGTPQACAPGLFYLGSWRRRSSEGTVGPTASALCENRQLAASAPSVCVRVRLAQRLSEEAQGLPRAVSQIGTARGHMLAAGTLAPRPSRAGAERPRFMFRSEVEMVNSSYAGKGANSGV